MSVTAQPAKESRGFVPALVLLVLAVLINYVDRGNISLAAPLIKTDWNLSASQLGILFSAFYWSYTALQFVVGWMVDRFNVATMMALGFLVWSLSTAATGLATGFVTLLLMRILLGIGESVMFPAASKMCAQHVPEQSRGMANGSLIAASRSGAAIGTLVGGLLMAKYGWRVAFLLIGLVSLLWIPAWMRWKPPVESTIVRLDRGVPSHRAILRQRSFWGSALGHFSGNYLVYFLITWLPYYLVHERHLSMGSMVGTAGVLYVIDSASSLLTGWLTDRCIKGGVSATVARKTAMAVGFSLAAVALLSCSIANERTYLGCLVVLAVGSGTSNSGNFAFPQSLAGIRAAGRWAGLQNGFANCAGIVGPALSGFLVDWSGNFASALAVASLVMVMGGISWTLIVGKLEPLEWPST